MTEPNRIRDMQGYEAGEGSEAPKYQTLAPRAVAKRIETRWEFGIFFRIYKNGRLVTSLTIGKGGRSQEPRPIPQALALSAPGTGDPAADPGVDAQEAPALPGNDGGPIEETRAEFGFFVGKVTTESVTDGSTD